MGRSVAQNKQEDSSKEQTEVEGGVGARAAEGRPVLGGRTEVATGMFLRFGLKRRHGSL